MNIGTEFEACAKNLDSSIKSEMARKRERKLQMR